MLTSVRKAIGQIDQLSSTTTAYKKQKLQAMRIVLVGIESDFDPNQLATLASLCYANLLDAQFTAKTISLFGLLKSRSEGIAREVLEEIADNVFLACMKHWWECIELLKENEIKEIYCALQDSLTLRDYAKAKEKCELLRDKVKLHYPDVQLDKSIAFVQRTLESWLALQIQLPNKKYYSALDVTFFEISFSQKIYHLDEVMKLMQGQSDQQSVSFIYVIDSRGNVIFSPGNGYHYKISGGAMVHGAGEIYFKRNKDRIDVELINNKSD